MTGMIKEDLLSIVKKKRFIILTALAYVGLIIFMICEKSEYFNDLTFFFAVNKYIFYVFDPLIGKVITGTETFAAVICGGKDDDEFLSGTVGEAFVLECASMGLGTCWLGLSYNRSIANSCIKLKNHKEKIRCLISIGHYDKVPEHKRSRKTIYNITGMGDDDFKKLPGWQRCAVEAGRLAPSARNAQPWEFDIMENSVQVAITSANMGYGEIDCGIAMLHIELGAAHCGYIGDWVFDEGYPIFRIIKE